MTDLNRRIAEAKGWTHCERSFGRSVGYPPGAATPSDIPDYTGDPREWVKLWAEIEACPTVFSVIAETSSGGGEDEEGPTAEVCVCRYRWLSALSPVEAPTLGEAVALAWIAWHAAEGKE